MLSQHKYYLAILVTSLLFLGSAMAAEKDKPTATVTIDQTQVMLLVGGSVGGGTLHFGDDSYSFKTGGLKIGGVGIHKISLEGDVYHLDNADDFAGVYFAAQAGITVAKGVAGIWLKNDKGVTMHLKGKADGLALSLGAEGLKVTME